MNKLLSVCIITKNEEKNIGDCLASLKNIANEIIVVDTGSTDRTIEIAKQYGADVYYFEWINDFSAARNESLKYATCDFILCIDADERLGNPDVLLDYLTKIKNQKELDVQIMTCKQINIFGKHINTTTSFSNVVRLFANNKGLHFEGKVHEQLYPRKDKILYNTNVELIHY